MNYHTDEQIMEQLTIHHNEAIKKYGYDRVLGTFLYGSQNYQADNEKSDVDSISIVVPTLQDLIDETHKPQDCIYLGEDNEEIVFIYDIRYFLNGLKNSVMSYLEMLFTKYYILNPKWKTEWDNLIMRREEIVKMNPEQFGQRVQESVDRSLTYLTGPPLASKHARIAAERGYVPKYLYHTLRLEHFVNTYLSNKPYRTLYREPLPEICGRAKAGVFTAVEARKLEDDTVAKIRAALRSLPTDRNERMSE